MKEDNIGTNNSLPFSKDTGSKVIHYLKANHDMFPFLNKEPQRKFDWNLVSVYKTHLINFLKFSESITVASFSAIGGPRWIHSHMIASMYEVTLTLGSIFFNGNKVKCSYFRVSHKTSLKVTLDGSKRHTQKPVKHRRWTFFPK